VFQRTGNNKVLVLNQEEEQFTWRCPSKKYTFAKKLPKGLFKVDLPLNCSLATPFSFVPQLTQTSVTFSQSALYDYSAEDILKNYNVSASDALDNWKETQSHQQAIALHDMVANFKEEQAKGDTQVFLSSFWHLTGVSIFICACAVIGALLVIYFCNKHKKTRNIFTSHLASMTPNNFEMALKNMNQDQNSLRTDVNHLVDAITSLTGNKPC